MSQSYLRFAAALLLLVILQLFSIPVYAQRSYQPRGQPEVRKPIEVREPPSSREDRPTILNEKLMEFLFNGARVDLLSPVDDSFEGDEGFEEFKRLIEDSGLKVCAMESRPYGINGIYVIHITFEQEGDFKISEDPELDAWARKVYKSQKAAEVQGEWLKFIYRRFKDLAKGAMRLSPNRVLLTIISSNLSLGALVAQPDDYSTKAFFNCSAFLVQVSAVTVGTSGSFGVLAALAMVGLVSDARRCVDSLKLVFKGAEAEQKKMEEEIARLKAEQERKRGQSSFDDDIGDVGIGRERGGGSTTSSGGASSGGASSGGASSGGASSGGASSKGGGSKGGGSKGGGSKGGGSKGGGSKGGGSDGGSCCCIDDPDPPGPVIP